MTRDVAWLRLCSSGGRIAREYTYGSRYQSLGGLNVPDVLVVEASLKMEDEVTFLSTAISLIFETGAPESGSLLMADM
jgi:hypothetical protein